MNDIYDLQSAIDFLNQNGEEIETYSEKIDPVHELTAHYIQHGAGVPGSPNCKESSPILYENVKNHSIPVLMGLSASRRRNNLLLSGNEKSSLDVLLHALEHRVPPQKTSNPLCRDRVITDINVLEDLPVLTLSPLDAGPYITTGLVYAKDPITGEKNCSYHRFCVHGSDQLSIFIVGFHHLNRMYTNALKKGESLPISINIGLDPAVSICSCFSDPVVKAGEDELAIAGGVRNRPIEIADCVSVDAECISHTEIVIEGEITEQMVAENPNDVNGFSLPEFLGYHSIAKPQVPLVKVKAITYKKDPIYQSLPGPGKEQSDLLGMPAEASMIKLLNENISKNFTNAHYSTAGGGLLFLILQIKKQAETDDAVVKQGGIFALSVSNFLKNIMIVDEDVNIFSYEDVFWAMTTRFQADQDITIIPNMPGFPADFSQSPAFSANIKMPGITSKSVFDLTVPFNVKKMFKRSFHNY